MLQPRSQRGVCEAVNRFGAAPFGQKQVEIEREAALHAIETGVYACFRSRKTGNDCARIGPSSICFCGHRYADHKISSPVPQCVVCKCRCFEYVPARPEEVGEWWLPRRKGFNVNAWNARCRCGRTHSEHDPVTKMCPGCLGFRSNYLCVVCDSSQEEHDTVFEEEAERRSAGRSVGQAFIPLSDNPDLQQLVLGHQASSSSLAQQGHRMMADAGLRASTNLRPLHIKQPEKSVRLMTRDIVEKNILQIEAIYREHAPSKLPNLPQLLQKFAGREHLLLKKAEAKYVFCANDAK